jgi:hypothetical protein
MKVRKESPSQPSLRAWYKRFVTDDRDRLIWRGWVVKYNVYVPPLLTTLHEPKTRIRGANTDQEILHNVWQEVEHRFDVARATRGTHNELY